MKKVTITIVPPAPRVEAERAFKDWARARPDVLSRLSESDIEVLTLRTTAEDGRPVGRTSYRITVSESDAALLGLPDAEPSSD